ncbi:MAG: MBL fold metallo-hydrolase [Victivallaceae bacterium]|nr:MBL fold metallo-hydrolase [Victivallaceae bacterium]
MKRQKSYCFDAGFGVGRSGVIHGVDWRNVKNFFISHGHIDHTGGLPEALFCCWKLRFSGETARQVSIYTPSVRQAQAALTMLHENHAAFENFLDVKIIPITEKLVFQDEIIRVEALANTHIVNAPTQTAARSYAFRITGPFGSIVYTGDLGSLDEGGIGEACDLRLMEDGHFRPEELLARLRSEAPQPKGTKAEQVVFLHHSREVMKDPDAALRRIPREQRKNIHFSCDGATFVFHPKSGWQLDKDSIVGHKTEEVKP